MTPSRWPEIEELYHAALDCAPGQRSALLAQADPELRREVESLLAQNSGPTPIDHPAWEGAGSLLGSTVAVLTTGTQLDPYKIEGPLGSGGMGEVFRAIDTRLGRSVAIKTSQEQFSARFDREARAISSLNHPNICTLHDVGPNYLVMELCEGETLGARLKRGKLSIQETLRYGAQIADALAAAHAKGITHRDLKPGNIILTKAGVKVLDFGLAKSPQDLTLTGTRMVMGTPAYMAPEQREAKECDARTDIYALGLVLYEMATGKRIVPGETHDQLPEKLAHVIERCVAQDPDERWQSARDIRALLVLAGKSHPTVATVPTHGGRLPWGIAAAFAVLTLMSGALYFRESSRPPPNVRSTRFFVSLPEKVEPGRALPAVSPDGEKLAFGAIEPDGKSRIWVRPLSSLTAEPVLGSEGVVSIFWSPDSRSVGFFAGDKIKRSDLNGGPPQTLCDASSVGNRPLGTWNRDGVVLFSSEDRHGLYRVPATGGSVSQVTALDTGRQEIKHYWPQFLPDGRHFVYLVLSANAENTGIYASSLDSKETKRVVDVSANPSYAESPSGKGHLLFMQGATLMAQAFDAGRLELQGERFPVAEQVLMPPASALGFAAFSTSANGVLVYRTARETTELVWFDRQGRRLGTVAKPGNYSVPALSPDEKTLAVRRTDTQIGTHDLWLFDLARGTSSRFTFDPAEETNPTWSPDGKKIAFSSLRAGTFDLYQKATTGAGIAELLMESSGGTIESWTPDGRFLIYNSGAKAWALPVNGDRTPTALFSHSGVHRVANVSPNMTWIAYDSNESGSNEIYVQSFPPSGSKFQVSTAGGAEPYWRRDGKELFYVEGQRLMAVEVNTTGQSFRFGPPKPLFEVRLETESRRSRYQVAANGQKFLVNVPLESAQPAPITVVTNWTAGLKK